MKTLFLVLVVLVVAWVLMGFVSALIGTVLHNLFWILVIGGIVWMVVRSKRSPRDARTN